MSQKNETVTLLLALLITLIFFGAGGWWLYNRFQGKDNPTNLPELGQKSVSAQARFSQGEKLLIVEGASSDKQAAIQALGKGDFQQAVYLLEKSLQTNRNDPEALIYLNNARIGEAKSYTIAVSVPIGSNVNTALEVLRGVAQSQNQINQTGGINGTPLKVLIADDADNPEIAAQIAQKLTADNSILGVVGHTSSDTSLAAAAIYQKAGLVMISPISTSVKLSNFGDYIFRSVPSDFVAARALAESSLQKNPNVKAVVFFNSQSNYSQSLKSEFITALGLGGGQVVSEFDLSSLTFTPSKSLQQAQQEGANLIALLGDSGTLDKALQVVQINGQKLPIVAGDDVYSPKTLDVGGKNALGMIVAVAWHLAANPNSPFVNNSRQLWQGDVNWRTATAYDATQALIAGIKGESSREGVQQALRSSDFSVPGATNPVRFLPSGDRNQSVQLVVVKPGSRSSFGVDFVPISR
ncbi:MAG: ABC transporter substrate-binding protein [Microcystis sp.]|jgi:branched-chain amino acid transport system substrate-binding protein|uniref:Receptor ligand binding family protein n=2 Tax=Microcystis TaxID=1125 RepID=A0A552L2V0_9CHRO|nr:MULTISPECIES: ABC transporter substrate-binding protein [unclassified Microcystis]MCA2815937.1 amino acid ABC transporter substrate-binding protein [Microcystis sp. M085S1]MCA2856690.1 amino acid ABC transporter substrate-binding protein [Microcystis sp. M065S1]MCZ8054489.1 ABC transporter substrate-binding protein [Microcystis sp. LE19-12.2C]TRT80665.1 MAG: receptor ligand binding family protein [Microcystis flos-aquae Ma_QC_C_20070823_S18]TRT99953.1 MAG: receptor ligand binding family pro